MTNQLSPAAQAVLDAAYALPLKNGQPNIAAALRAVAINWEREVSGQPSTESILGIKNCITALTELAEDLEPMRKRVDIKAILADPKLSKELMDGATDFICKVERIRE